MKLDVQFIPRNKWGLEGKRAVLRGEKTGPELDRLWFPTAPAREAAFPRLDACPRPGPPILYDIRFITRSASAKRAELPPVYRLCLTLIYVSMASL